MVLISKQGKITSLLSIEQDLCTGCGKCPEIFPKHFFMADDGLAYVKEGDLGTPDEIRQTGILGTVAVASEDLEKVIEAVEGCPVECIYVEESASQAQVA